MNTEWKTDDMDSRKTIGKLVDAKRGCRALEATLFCRGVSTAAEEERARLQLSAQCGLRERGT